MADLSERLAENAEGDFFVDSSCIDCESCMIVAPETFAESPRSLSFVRHQPQTPEAIHRAMMAVIACPTSSIGTVSRRKSTAAAKAFPEEIADGIFYLGYASEDSYGASSYLIRRPDGNVLVDSPRAAGPLLAGIKRLGGAKWLFLTHRDDIADHEKLHAVFGCERVMMREDVLGIDCEIPLDGPDPTRLADDVVIIPVPGHSRGSAALLYRNEFLFTGDHLWADAEGRLDASRNVSWYSWTEQKKSLEKLLAIDFRVVLPGHGRRYFAKDAAEAHAELARLVARKR